MKVACAAPRLKASMPTLPVPAKRSRKRASSTRLERISKSAVFTRSMMGRVPAVLGALSLRPLASPVTTRMFFPSLLLFVQHRKHDFYFIHKVIFFGPGDQRFHLVLLQLFVGGGIPDSLDQLLELRVADLRVEQIMQDGQTSLADR